MKTTLMLGGFVIFIALLLSWNHFLGTKSAATISTDPNNLPGIETGNAPWPAEIPHLRERLHAIGLPPLGSEGTTLHIHQHLDLVIDGKPVAIPAGIGINQAANFISDIHVHDTTGVIHVESPTVQTFTLGQFFDIWGVRFTKDCVGGYCGSATSTVRVYVNGTLVPGDPRSLVLAAHQEIVVVYGTEKDMPKVIPSSYSFPPGD